MYDVNCIRSGLHALFFRARLPNIFVKPKCDVQMVEKILIVDDDIDSLRLIGLMLQRHGYEVVAANTGGQALSKAESENPALVILDVMMPDMNGLEVCRRLRGNPNTQEIPIIMFTAKTLIDDKVKGFEAGADDYLTKPTHPAELASRVRAILERKTSKPSSSGGGSQKGSTLGFIGVKGGVGTSTVALNVTASLMQNAAQPVLADFRLGNGSLSAFLGLPQVQSMARLLSKPASEINSEFVQSEVVAHESGLNVLLSSARPREGLITYSADTALAVVEQMRSLFGLSVYDLGCGYDTVLSRIQTQMDRLYVIVEPNAATLKMAHGLITELESEQTERKVEVIVVNRAQSSLQTSWQEVEQILGREIKAILSAAPELAFQAMENRMPMVMLQPNAIVSTQLIKIADDVKGRLR